MKIEAKKSLGQNFLIDDNIINKIINELGDISDSLVIEIGPGRGAITKGLVKKAKRVLAYELDIDCVKYLDKEIKEDNFILKHQDILKANLKEDIKKAKEDCAKVYIIGNLPYYITTPIMLKLIEEDLKVDKYLFMVQEEVANRYTSLDNNKEYNALTVYLNYLFNTKKCFIVKNTSFYPIPKVESAIISLEPNLNKLYTLNEENFLLVNKLIFRQKRKTLVNNLKDKYDLNIIKQVFINLRYKESIRAEELSIKDIINLSDELFKLTNVYELAYAKINLSLRVFAEKNNYHPLSSLMVNVNLCDDLVFIKSKETKIYSNIDIKDNVILKTIELFKETYNIKDNVTIYLKKRIPLSAGLAGGSADSSAVLRGLNRLFNLNKSLEELSELANVLGSDNNFCLYNKPAICTNRGEVLEFIPNFKEIPILLINPNFELSTKEIYQNYIYQDKEDTIKEIVVSLINNDIKNLEKLCFNDLEKAALLNKDYQEFVNNLNGLNIKTYQTGSGPTRFAFDIDSYDLLKEKTNYLIIKTIIHN